MLVADRLKETISQRIKKHVVGMELDDRLNTGPLAY